MQVYRTPNIQNYSRPTPSHIIRRIKNTQNKDKISKATREKYQVTYRGKPIQISADFLIQILNARRSWNTLKKKWMPTKNLISSKTKL
uniref:L1 transposable element RRM domain-containing protein n=1 Tax=Spermophilus dauricus TaxID=99837 RepID=A0A8C9QHB5_SPEDA